MAAAFLHERELLAGRAAEFAGIELMRAYSDLTDALVRRVCALAAEESGVADAPRELAIAAVGGYGRHEMSPFSDVDVAFIVGIEEDDAVDQVVKRAFRTLMDVLELSAVKVGYSYRRVDDVENLPIEVQTALLDARRITGGAAVFNAFSSALRKAISPAAFVVAHLDSRTSRGSRSDTPFVVEPDIKEGHGGLRDLHASRWMAQVAFGLKSEAVWDGLRARGILRDGEISDALVAADFVSRVRNTLHLLAGRSLDVLSVERHAQVAEALGFPSAKQFVSVYYRHAHHLWRTYRKVAAACLRGDLEVEPGMTQRDGRLRILDRGLLTRDSAAVLRAFQHTRAHRLEMEPDAAELVSAAALDYRPTVEASRTFVEIISRPEAGATLRSMADMGVLQAIVPRFGELMYLVPEDAAHRFTVGEHCLRTVEHLESLFLQGDERFADVFSRIQHFDALFLAALLHDIGKLDSKRDHSKTGAFRAAEFAAMLGLPEDACAKVEFLVRHHLKMAETARLRDLHQPKTVRDFIGIVKDVQLLDMLFLLTVADNAAVGTVNWSRVQMRFLLELHERAAAALRSPEAAGPDIDRHRTRVRRELGLANLPADLVSEHCDSMPAAYLLNTPPDELAAHIGFVRAVRDGSQVVDIKDDRAGEFTVLTVAAMDRPRLLSDVAGVMHAIGVDIHAAQIFTRSSSDEIAIDTLYIDFEGRQLTEMKKWQVEGDLTNVLAGQVTVGELLKRWGKGAFTPVGEMTVNALENLSDHETVIEVRAVDSPGLLFHLTRKIADMDWNIHSARVATWGHEARDVFYVTDRSGAKLGLAELERFRALL